MAKTIKFNLICDDMPIRTIEDLQEHFSIEDVLAYYRNGLLVRWLEVRGYNDEVARVKEINMENNLDIIKELIEIFSIPTGQYRVEESVYIMEYRKECEDRNKRYEEECFKLQSVINDYMNSYMRLVTDIIKFPRDAAHIKASINEIALKYSWCLRWNYRELFWILYQQSPLAIMCLLMNERTRLFYLDDYEFHGMPKSFYGLEESVAQPSYIPDINGYRWSGTADDKIRIKDAIINLTKTPNFEEELGGNLRCFRGYTDGYWKDIEPKGKKCMLINMGYGAYARPAGVMGGEKSSEGINKSFMIFDGIDFKSNSESLRLLYMEV